MMNYSFNHYLSLHVRPVVNCGFLCDVSPKAGAADPLNQTVNKSHRLLFLTSMDVRKNDTPLGEHSPEFGPDGQHRYRVYNVKDHI